MPVFEALVRRQQKHQSAADDRLSLLEPSAASGAMVAPLGFLAFAGGLIGALIGTAGVQFALAKGWISF
ncbi:MAG: hypothetical protein VKK63_05370 [Synechococcus sp.]|nr:hypothetical protein [Synechococcus sp.]